MADAAIQQLNLGYDGEQDRLLLKIGLSDDTELSVWLTRRLVKLMWALLQQSGVPSIAMTEVISEPSSKPSATQVNYADAYQLRTVSRLVEPMLANDCYMLDADEKFGPQAKETKAGAESRASSQALGTAEIISAEHKSLQLKAKNGSMMKIVLSAELTQALAHMLQLATKEAAWDIGFASHRIVMRETSARPVLH